MGPLIRRRPTICRPTFLTRPESDTRHPCPQAPGTFHPATAITTPMVRALDLSEGAMASATSILGSPPLSTRPGRARHPRFQRRVFSCQPFSARHPLTPRWHLLSHPAMLRATPKVATPGVSEGADCRIDTHRRSHAPSVLTRPSGRRHPHYSRRVFLVQPLVARLPFAVRWTARVPVCVMTGWELSVPMRAEGSRALQPTHFLTRPWDLRHPRGPPPGVFSGTTQATTPTLVASPAFLPRPRLCFDNRGTIDAPGTF